MSALVDNADWYEPVFEFKDRVRKIRESLEMEQDEFGGLFGVTDKAVSRWERGRNKPRDLMGFAQKLERITVERMPTQPVRWEWILGATGTRWYDESSLVLVHSHPQQRLPLELPPTNRGVLTAVGGTQGS